MEPNTPNAYNEKDSYRIALQEFQKKLNTEPDPREFEPTPDGKARTLPISFVEMTLDELYLGLWETTNPNYQQVFNEVIGSLVLVVTNPVTGKKQRRAGYGSVVITQDKDAQIADFNMTKKKNALDLAFPKLKAECVKNAAQSLGKIFGRDINRKKTDTFKPALIAIPDKALEAAIKRVEEGDLTVITKAENSFLMTDEQKEMLRGAQPNTKRLTNG